jgi:uncharacterized protein YndB with AHSA1/START domain
MPFQEAKYAVLTPSRAAVAVGIGLLSGLLYVIVPYGLVRLYAVAFGNMPGGGFTSVSGFNQSLTVLFPMVQGFALAMALGPKKYRGAVIVLLVLALASIELVGAWIFLREGVICLIILLPLILALMLFGAVLGRLLMRGAARRAVNVSLIPLIVLGVFAEALGPRPDYTSAVTDSITVNAPAEYVWRYVLEYPENRAPPEYWLWRIGLPQPIQSTVEAARVGATRVCMFDNGIAFEERITELQPDRLMVFEVTKQPDDPEVTGHFRFDRGQIQLTQNADGSTTVSATSWYHLYVRPAVYFDWWTAEITRQVHFRVLNHMKALAERDFYTSAAAPSSGG